MGTDYKSLMDRKNEIMKKAIGIDYSDFETGTLAFDYERMMKEVGYSLKDIREIQSQTGVGTTPLLELRNMTRLVRKIAPAGKGARIFLKDEASNPSGSFKARRAATAVYHAQRLGYKGVIAATSGNYGAAVASQAAMRGLDCIIVQECYDSKGKGQPEIIEKARKCEAYGADVRAVREGMCADHRIGNQFLYPGLGYGGSCFPKDTRAVIGMGKAVGFDCRLNSAVHEVNQDQRAYFWEKIVGHFGPNLQGKTLAFWGVAFKPETDDVRESPAISLMQMALAAGAKIHAVDRAAARVVQRILPQVNVFEDMYEALEGCDGLIICTEWSEFRNPDFACMGERLRDKVIFDGRNIYRRKLLERHGFTYHSVGRPAVIPEVAAPLS